ncbi:MULTISPECIES: FAD-dependent monooxygenase [Gammaproteobacteria]|uniref:FAD-dependent monooxygenase n=1 Tax=Gammaproteobacteria TaxID=1236 RepID=UPI000DD05C0E|nr:MULTISPECIES: FAD-dependent monooxygenase [Gammaproteobacteria]RTE85526.1 hypothetical protein DQX04_11525 [Aliidiomarina sp. B3213]TCZ89496.1 hypothetical protein EYQ95_11455 [Lysobacter sp. N42]
MTTPNAQQGKISSNRIVLAGAGLVGMLAAVVLKQTRPDFDVLLLDTRKEDDPTKDPRAIALSRRTVWALKQYGVWQLLEQFLPNITEHAIETIHISDATGPGSNKLESAEHGEEPLGFVIPAAQAMKALDEKRKELGVEIRYQSSVTNISGTAACVALKVNEQETIEAQLLLSCDGSASQMRDLLGVQENIYDYQQMAIAAEVDMVKAHGQVAYERFTPEGPMALLPLGSRRYSMVWCGTWQSVQKLMELPEQDFIRAATSLLGGRAGSIKHVERLAAFPLRKITVDRFCGYRWALIGNACHTLHPVAGQGYNLGVRDVLALAERLRYAEDAGANTVLESYQKARKADYKNVVGFTDSVVHLFSSTDPIASYGRRVGLKSMRLCSTLRNAVASKAMGFETERSRWD